MAVERIIDDVGLDVLFRQARTHRSWTDRPVSDELLQAIYDLAKMAPTSSNTSPMRVLFVKSREARQRLLPCLDEGNVRQTETAPVTAIVAYDARFYEELPKLNPRIDVARYAKRPLEQIQSEAFRNGSLQGAYFIIAARALGLDCGPMGGFSRDKVDAEFFPDGRWKSNFLCNIGYGDGQGMKPRAGRLSFEDACRII
jgi:3-hydroxypropanoate dehydrogenase